jgi:AraC-like DNA-binding protein
MSVAPGGAFTADLLLRGAVAGVLLFHIGNLLLPGPRPAVRAALAAFVLALLAYLLCQRAELLVQLPAALAVPVLGLCVSGAGWLWLAAKAVFDDAFVPRLRWLAVPLALAVLGLAANLPRWRAAVAGAADPPLSMAGQVHAVAMLACMAAALWQVARGWRDDLVEPRRDLRRWVGIGIGLYGALALVVELAVRGLDVGLLLPALHVAGIGTVALALALLIARRSLAVVLGLEPALPEAGPLAVWQADGAVVPARQPEEAMAPARQPEAAMAVVASPAPQRHDAAAPTPPDAAPPAAQLHFAAPSAPPRALSSAARQHLEQALSARALHRREGLTLSALAAELQLGEDALRRLINHELGFRNFNDFLHHHRLAEAAPRLAAEQLPILSIALECGYGSIGPFNRAFRQRFGMTPSEYRAAARMKRLDSAPPDE